MERLQGKTAIPAAAKYLGFCCVLMLLGCNRTPQQSAATQAADEAAVRQTDENWSKAAQSKKVDYWVAFYSDDAVLLPPNDKKASGKENDRKVIADLLGLPGLALSWEPAKVEVAQSGDLAYTQGSYQLTTTDAHGKPMTDQGKTLEVWKKQADGAWKCVADMWSSDLPATPPQ
jgi:ketosteroid isomerase-like protein